MSKLVWAMLILVGCAPYNPYPFKGIDAELQSYVDEFSNLVGAPIGTPMRIADFDGRAVGKCYLTTYDDITYGWVLIKPSYWEKASDHSKRMLIFHELGHCWLGKDHRKDKLANGCPASIMYVTILSEYCYNKDKDYYLKELISL